MVFGVCIGFSFHHYQYGKKMNCAEFEIWLLDKDDHDQSADQEAKLHRLSCSRCEKLYTLDQIMEERVVESFAEVDLPADLIARIKYDGRYADVDEPGPALRWKFLAATLATAVIMCVVFINPFSGQIRDIDEIGTLAVANHLNNDMRMTFKAGQISDVSAWFAERIGYPVAVPDMAGQGVTFLGGAAVYPGAQKSSLSYV